MGALAQITPARGALGVLSAPHFLHALLVSTQDLLVTVTRRPSAAFVLVVEPGALAREAEAHALVSR